MGEGALIGERGRLFKKACDRVTIQIFTVTRHWCSLRISVCVICLRVALFNWIDSLEMGLDYFLIRRGTL